MSSVHKANVVHEIVSAQSLVQLSAQYSVSVAREARAKVGHSQRLAEGDGEVRRHAGDEGVVLQPQLRHRRRG